MGKSGTDCGRKLTEKSELPTFENAEEFVKRLVSKDLVKRDAEIAAALNNEPRAFSRRTAQPRLLRVVGITFNVMRQIERARSAVNLLREDVSIVDAVRVSAGSGRPRMVSLRGTSVSCPHSVPSMTQRQ